MVKFSEKSFLQNCSATTSVSKSNVVPTERGALAGGGHYRETTNNCTRYLVGPGAGRYTAQAIISHGPTPQVRTRRQKRRDGRFAVISVVGLRFNAFALVATVFGGPVLGAMVRVVARLDPAAVDLLLNDRNCYSCNRKKERLTSEYQLKTRHEP